MQLQTLSLVIIMGFGAPVVAQLGLPPEPPENPVTESKRVLGKILFFDAQLSSDNTTSCSTCHMPEAGGADPIIGGHPGPDGLMLTEDDIRGSFGVVRADINDEYVPDALFDVFFQVTDRVAPSFFTGAYSPDALWDGRASGTFRDPLTGEVVIPSGGGLESQSLEALMSDVEMVHEGRTWQQVTDKLAVVEPMYLAGELPPDMDQALAGAAGYPDLFFEAFGTSEITPVRIALAIASYERTLVPDRSPWDFFQAGQLGALTPNQQLGMDAFMSPELKCSECHVPPLFSDNSFRNIGIRPIEEDAGRFNVTGDVEDRGRFKVPSLRNVGLRSRFFHNGDRSITSLFEAVKLYDGGGGDFLENQDPLLAGIELSDEVAAQITDFLANGLTDRRLVPKSFPFDTPGPAGTIPNLEGDGVPGAGGVPNVIRNRPPNVGNFDYKIGVSNALGGALAWVVLSGTDPIPGPGDFFPIGPIVLPGSGASGGYGTMNLPIPADSTLVGLEAWARWWVRDPSAQANFARSRYAHITLF